MMHSSPEWQHDTKKLSEELIELASELIKQANKPWQDRHAKIQDELADVTYRLDKVIQWYDTKVIAKRMAEKSGDKDQ